MEPITDKSRLTRLGHVVDTEDALIPARRDGQFWHRDGDVVVVVAGLHFKITHDFLFATDENGEPLPDVMNPFTRNRLPALFGARGTPQDRTKDIAKFRGFTIMQLVNATSLALQLQRRDFIDYALEALPIALRRLFASPAALHRRRVPRAPAPQSPAADARPQAQLPVRGGRVPDVRVALRHAGPVRHRDRARLWRGGGCARCSGTCTTRCARRMDAEDDKKEEDDDDDDEEDEDDEDVFSSPKRENSCVARLAPIHRQRLFVGALSLHSFWLRTMLRAPASLRRPRTCGVRVHSASSTACRARGQGVPDDLERGRGGRRRIIKAFRLSLPSHFLGPANEEEEEAVFCDSSDEEDAWEEGSTEEDEDEDGEDTIRVSFQATSILSKNEHGDDQDARPKTMMRIF
ncbi:unnamed protein product [Mycena citricolor]|uniref:Uncharacterized protein n=1 Tax=Mycena citricolor TaxID=2018698 RepID=A0AAD2HKB4_9AGAR|nr:unnamed protein product [Mycena citricolor]